MTGALQHLPLVALLAAGCLPRALADAVPSILEKDVVLAPSAPYHAQVAIGEAKFLRFSCMGGPADVVVTLSSYAEEADPLLFLSLDPNEKPSFSKHDGSSFGQWREDPGGDHYVIAKGVSPEGGLLGLVNVRPFAKEELDAILSIQCTYIIAFDALFWNHLKTQEVCPIGGSRNLGNMIDPDHFCSRHGTCVAHGVCDCDADFTGPACEHRKEDIVTAAEGRYRFKLDSGSYQYLRVRVPYDFPGGYLEVKTWGERPLVVLIRGDDLPTKGNYELSNFEDWISGRNVSVLRYQVPAISGFFDAAQQLPRRLEESQEVVAKQQPQVLPRALQGRPEIPDDCPKISTPTGPACATHFFQECQDSCRTCAGCVKRKDSPGCSQACTACSHDTCLMAFTRCAGNSSCTGQDALYCKSRCGGCMACMESNDPDCARSCECCNPCLPLAAKCHVLDKAPEEQTRYVYVGVYNHRRYFNDVASVHAVADASLKLDPQFAQAEVPSSWLADLYDPFYDIRDLGETQREMYPEGEQYIYDINPRGGEMRVEKQVRIYRDRMTLLHIENEDLADKLLLSFTGANVSHILVSTQARPKTLFDFNSAPNMESGRLVTISADGMPALWCAIFGGTDGWTQVVASRHAEDGGPTLSFALICIIGFMGVLLAVGYLFGHFPALGESPGGLDDSASLCDKLWLWFTRKAPHESTQALTLDLSMSGCMSSEAMNRHVEDQFLHRGGMGDDGI